MEELKSLPWSSEVNKNYLYPLLKVRVFVSQKIHGREAAPIDIYALVDSGSPCTIMPFDIWEEYLDSEIRYLPRKNINFLGGVAEFMDVLNMDIEISRDRFTNIDVLLSKRLVNKYMLIGTDFLTGANFKIKGYNFSLKKLE